MVTYLLLRPPTALQGGPKEYKRTMVAEAETLSERKNSDFYSCKLQDCILQAEVTSQGCIFNLADAWEGAVGGWRRPKL